MAIGDDAMPLGARFRLDGRTVLIIGASRGIGRQAALVCAEVGARVVLAARSVGDLEEVARAALAAGAPEALVQQTDAADEAAIERLVARAAGPSGKLDVMIHVAGGQQFFAALADTRTAGWDKVMDLNLRGPFLACRAALPRMPRGGAIVNVASVAGLGASPTIGVYGAAKAGLIGMTRTLAVEAAPQGVRVNCLAPGWVRTELTRRLWSDPETSQATIKDVPMGRWGEVEELAGPLLLLVTDAGSYITGATLVVDGGGQA
ncbi:MAG TPA: SDR family oxidoreductase [Actinomycetes bacterium]|nr:SDR family oxidoreductase [Actinomycetes bacterium]